MFVFSNLLIGLANVIGVILSIAYWLILIRALISWVNPDPFNPIVQFLYRMTEPILEPVRRRLPPMGIDLSPIVVFLLIIFLQSFLIRTLYQLAGQLAA